jgi:hypothetical protein
VILAVSDFRPMGSMILILVQLLIGLIAAALVERVGRRPLFLTATTGSFTFFSLFYRELSIH